MTRGKYHITVITVIWVVFLLLDPSLLGVAMAALYSLAYGVAVKQVSSEG